MNCMVQKPKDTGKEMPGPVKVEPAKKFSGRERLERIAASYDVHLVGSNEKNDAIIVVLKGGRELGRYCIAEGETGLIDDTLVVSNLGVVKFNNMVMGGPQLYIGHVVPVG